MRSRIPKVLHPLAGRPMIDHVLDGARGDAAIDAPGGRHRPRRRGGRGRPRRSRRERAPGAAARDGGCRPRRARAPFRTMRRPSSSRWATRRCIPAELSPARSSTSSRAAGAAIALVSARLANPSGYGRIVRGPDGGATAIVEEADADDATRALDEVNAGTYAFDAAWLRAAIGRVTPSAGGELYLTDLVAIAVDDGRAAASSSPRTRPTRSASTTGSRWPMPRRGCSVASPSSTCATGSRSSTRRRRGSTRRSRSARTRASSRGRSWRARPSSRRTR